MRDNAPDGPADDSYPDLALWLREERDRTQRLRIESGELKDRALEAIHAAERTIVHAKRMVAALKADGFLEPRKRG